MHTAARKAAADPLGDVLVMHRAMHCEGLGNGFKLFHRACVSWSCLASRSFPCEFALQRWEYLGEEDGSRRNRGDQNDLEGRPSRMALVELLLLDPVGILLLSHPTTDPGRPSGQKTSLTA